VLLKEVCVLDVASCGRNAGVIEAARLMRKHHTGDLIVVDDPNGDRVPVGIVTDRDIVVEVLANELDPAATNVANIMSARLVIASGDEDVAVAIERMRAHGVRRLPVVGAKGSLIGIVTLDDALKLHAAQAAALADIVTREQGKEYRARR
jgi:CBS domain-containing protein